MEFIATYWYVWLIMMFIGAGCFVSRPTAAQMKNDEMMKSHIEKSKSFFNSFGMAFVFAAMAICGAILLFIAVVANTPEYYVLTHTLWA